MQLRWLDAGREHKAALKAFTCTDPPKPVWDRYRKRPHHPRRWEYDVQQYVRTKGIPVQLPERVLLGFEGDQLRSFIHFTLYDEDDLVWVHAVACDQACRGRGYATEAYEAMYQDLADLGWTGGFEATGRLHPSNEASKRAFARAGGSFDRMDGDLERWSVLIP